MASALQGTSLNRSHEIAVVCKGKQAAQEIQSQRFNMAFVFCLDATEADPEFLAASPSQQPPHLHQASSSPSISLSIGQMGSISLPS